MQATSDEQQATGHDDGARPHGGPARVRETLAGACGPCPERDGAMRRELLCRCPVALGLRLLIRIERFGPDPGGIPASERASLDFQERALSRRLPPFDLDSVQRAGDLLASGVHDACAQDGCLPCRAHRVVHSLLAAQGA